MSAEQQEYQEYLEYLEYMKAHQGGSETATAPRAQVDAPAQATLEGFGQGATMGYLPQLQALAEPAMAKALDFATGQDVSESLPSYVERRDENLSRQRGLAEDNPTASLIGKGAGIVTSGMALPAGAAAKGVGFASKVGSGALTGAALGAAANPGDQEGIVHNPLEGDFQFGDRATNAAIGGLTGGALSAAGAGVSALADKSRMVEQVKDSAGLSKHVKGQVDDALQAVNDKYIAPRRDQLHELLQGRSVEVNPDRLQDTLPNLAKSMAKKVNAEGRREIGAARADRLKRLLDAKASYNNSKPFDTTAVAKGESAKAAADIVRGKLRGLDPGVGKLYDEMGEAIRLRDALGRQSASTPIASIRSRPGTDKGSIIDAIDKMAGTRLEKLGQSIDDAAGLLIKPSKFVKPLEAPNELRKLVVRGAAGASRGLEKALPEASLQDSIRAVMESRREK